MDVINLIPDAAQMAQVFAQAAAPAFFLGACVALAALLMTRLNDVMGRLRDATPEQRARQAGSLMQRAKLLQSAIGFALAGASFTTLLLMVTFAAALLRLQHAFGAPILFLAATIMVGGSLLRFGQEVRAGLAELDEYT